MSKFILACRGEGHWGSREEDNSKIDLIFSFEHPWASGERMMVLCQVKSGNSYGSLTENGFELKSKAKAAAIRSSHQICVVWIDRNERKAFWAYIHPDSVARAQKYGAYHEVTPATKFDLARCISMARSGSKGAKGLHIRRRDTPIAIRRKTVKGRYQDIRTVRSPVLGEIELGRVGWRHMFRKGRRKEGKIRSLEIIPYLHRLLPRWPTTHAITSSSEFKVNGYTYQVREHLLKFDELTVSSKNEEVREDLCAHVRVREEICYPNDWESVVMLSQQVKRRIVLKSAYYK
ncbi:hypothetical protein [Alcanivorax hongdengensis]|uniref:hypothetical protein n=1 Tax=Alcanivorax hongdengensis TaxID=519051 RepID=UPI00192A9785|nr:hypothetical protein [Alcanivorax hongdengensis]